MLVWVLRKPRRKLPDAEACLDLFDVRRALPEDSIHPAFNTEAVLSAVKLGTDRHFGFVEGFGLGPLLLHATMDLATFRSRSAVTRLRFDTPGTGNGQCEIADRNWDGFPVRCHGRCRFYFTLCEKSKGTKNDDATNMAALSDCGRGLSICEKRTLQRNIKFQGQRC